MGKIRVKLVGDTTEEQNLPAGRHGKPKAKQEAKKTAKAPGLKGGERVVSVGPSIEELEKQTAPEAVAEQATPTEKKQKAKFAKAKKKILSTRHTQNLSLLKMGTLYPLSKAIELLKQFKKTSFDETVELHINTKEKGVSGQVSLPHGTGKKIRIKVADPSTGSGQALDILLKEIESGTIDFDVLVATPSAMSKLAKVARILGPRGLMPNPKAGTITDKPEALIEKLSKGQVNFKTETEAPIIHMSVGKLSFKENQLEDNVKSVLSAVGTNKIANVTLKSSMSPGIKVDISALN